MMNNNKYASKLTSIILCIMLLFSVVPTMATGAAEKEHILLCSDNFAFSGNYSQEVSDGLSNKIFASSVKVQRLDAVTSKFYAPESGEYAVWCMTGASNADTNRVPKLTIGSETKLVPFSNELSWKKEIWTLAAGWNNVSFTTNGEWLPYFLNAIYITDDLEVEITTDNDDELLAYADTEAPVFDSDAAIETAFEGSICTITFPQATDGDNTALYYEYTLNGNTAAIVDINEGVNVGIIAEDTTVTLTVYDRLGYKAEKTFNIAAPELPALPEGENMLLSGENFNVPAYTNGGYISNGGTATGNLFEKSIKIAQNGDTNFSTARVYIKEAGKYNLWVLSGNENDAADRYAKVGFDSMDMQNVSAHALHEWDKTEWTLEAGWHDLKVGICASWKNTLVNALYITSDLSYEPDTETDDMLLAFTDTTAPTIGDGAITTEYDGEDCIVTFPEATGGTDELILYGYTVDGNTKEISDIAQPVNIGQISGDTAVTLIAYDKFGNASSKDFTVKAPEKPLTSDGFLLTYKNFTVPAYPSGGIVSGVTGALVDSNIKVNGGDTSLYATAEFYVAEEGDYALWLYSGNADDIAARHPVAYIDDEKDLSSFNATKTLKWNKGLGTSGNGVYHLTKGWHTVKLGLSGGWLPYLVNAVYITDDLAYEVTTANDDKILKQQGDTEAPKFDATSVDAVYKDYTSCTLKFPEVSDGSSIAEAVYYVNDEVVTVTDNSIVISNLMPLETLSVKAEAYDKFGNKAVFEDKYLSAPVKADSFKMIKSGAADALKDLSALKAEDVIKLDTKLYNRTGIAKTIEVSLCLYSADYERMLLCATSEVALGANAKAVPAVASLTLPKDFVNTSGCIITATLWDKTSGEPYVEGIEIKGAE